MKLSIAAIAVLASSAVALPQLSKRQTVQNELSGPCKKVTFVWARASTETNNMGLPNSVGPGLCSALKRKYSQNVACQGVGSPAYTAGLMDNVSATGTTQSAINEAIKHYTTANSKCPQTKIVTGGFSQGTAVILNAIMKLDAPIKNKIVGTVLYGYTKNKQTGGQIKGYPQDRLKVFCPAADGVCGGMLNVNAGHFAYLMDGTIKQGADFLISKIDAGGA